MMYIFYSEMEHMGKSLYCGVFVGGLLSGHWKYMILIYLIICSDNTYIYIHVIHIELVNFTFSQPRVFHGFNAGQLRPTAQQRSPGCLTIFGFERLENSDADGCIWIKWFVSQPCAFVPQHICMFVAGDISIVVGESTIVFCWFNPNLGWFNMPVVADYIKEIGLELTCSW